MDAPQQPNAGGWLGDATAAYVDPKYQEMLKKAWESYQRSGAGLLPGMLSAPGGVSGYASTHDVLPAKLVQDYIAQQHPQPQAPAYRGALQNAAPPPGLVNTASPSGGMIGAAVKAAAKIGTKELMGRTAPPMAEKFMQNRDILPPRLVQDYLRRQMGAYPGAQYGG